MPTIKIVSRWDSSKVLYECDAETLREAVIRAVRDRADLAGAYLAGANLERADLERANLAGAYLERANLAGANLERANLDRADLAGAYLAGANLDRADLAGAYLAGAYLAGAYLAGANLGSVKADLFSVLDAAPREVRGLLAALRAGHIDGSTYTGACACLVGTIANVAGKDHCDVPGIVPNGGRPAERWFLAIRPGHMPTNSEVARITEEWIEEWLAAHPEASQPLQFWRVRRHGVVTDDLLTSSAAAKTMARLRGGVAVRVTAKAPRVAAP